MTRLHHAYEIIALYWWGSFSSFALLPDLSEVSYGWTSSQGWNLHPRVVLSALWLSIVTQPFLTLVHSTGEKVAFQSLLL